MHTNGVENQKENECRERTTLILRKEVGDIFCPINGNEGIRRLVSEQSKSLCDKGQTYWHIDKEEDGHGEVENEQGSAFELLARTDVPRGQKEVNWHDDEWDNRNGQRRSSPQGLF